MKARSIFFATTIYLLSIVFFNFAAAQTADSTFQQAVEAYQKTPSPDSAEKVIVLANALPQLPPIPEEARKHFIRGAELFKDSKSPDDMEKVVDELGQATHFAPWWPEARYNWALALEAWGNYGSAIMNLKLYCLFKVSDKDARDAQDKIYALEARQEKDGKPIPKFTPTSAPQRAAYIGNLHFNYEMRAEPFVRIVSGTVEDPQGLWSALLPLQPPPGAHGGYGLIGDDKLLGHEAGYGLTQLGMIARKYIRFEQLHVEQPSGWEAIGVQAGEFAKPYEMNDTTLGWAFFDVRGNFEADLKKLLNLRP